jgi:putative NIF3 family GTP cyclohydrolase 1 type 2
LDLGWTNYLENKIPQPHCYSIPTTTLTELADFIKKTLDVKIIQIVGEMNMPCHRVGILVGGGSLGLGDETMPATTMREQNLDVIICGEITEWTLSAYVRDAAALGFKKALLVIGHERSEEPGMKELANRIQPLLGNIPIYFSDSGEPLSYIV